MSEKLFKGQRIYDCNSHTNGIIKAVDEEDDLYLVQLSNGAWVEANSELLFAIESGFHVGDLVWVRGSHQTSNPVATIRGISDDFMIAYITYESGEKNAVPMEDLALIESVNEIIERERETSGNKVSTFRVGTRVGAYVSDTGTIEEILLDGKYAKVRMDLDGLVLTFDVKNLTEIEDGADA